MNLAGRSCVIIPGGEGEGRGGGGEGRGGRIVVRPELVLFIFKNLLTTIFQTIT